MGIINLIKMRNIFLRLFIVIILCLCCLQVKAESSSQNVHANKGIFSRFFKNKKNDLGLYKTQLEMKYYEEQIKKNPKDIVLLEKYGKYLKDHKYYDKSLKIYYRLLTLTKNNKYKADIKEIKAYKNYNLRDSTFMSYINQAKEFEASGQIKQANEYYLKASEMFSDRFEAKFGLAKTYGWLNNTEQSDKLFQELLKDFPNNISVLETYAMHLKDRGNYAKVIEIYNKLFYLTKNSKYKKIIDEIILSKETESKKQVLKEEDKSFSDYIKQAKIYESKGNIKKANEYYLKADKIYPQRYEPLFGLAKTYGWLGKKQLANDYYQRSLKLAPKDPDLIAAYNKFLKESKKQKIKQPTFTPDIAGEYIQQAQKFESLAQIEKANEYYKKAQQIDSSRYEVKFGLARTYGWLHNDDLAMKYYTELLKQTPDNISLLENYADFLKIAQKYSESLEIYQKLSTQNNDVKYSSKIAEIYFLQKDYMASLKLYQDIYNQNPNNPDVQKSIANIYFVSGDFNKAIEFYEKYFLQKSDPESVVTYSKCLFYTKQTPIAQQILENYLSQHPNDIEALSTLADIYISLRNTQSARLLNNKALCLAPDKTNLQIQSARIDIAEKNYENAKCILASLLEKEPHNSEILENLGDISIYTGEFNEALCFFQSIDNYENSVKLKYKIAQAHHYNKEYVLSEGLYKELTCDPEYGNKAKIGVAEIKIIKDKAPQARKILREVLLEEPDNVQAKKNLAIAWYTTGDNLTSINILKSLPNDDPDIEDINYNLAKAYYKIERNDVALDLLKNNSQDKAKTLRAEIKMLERPAVEPFFDIYHMSGNANAGKYFKIGGNGYYYIKPNLRLVGNASTVEYRNVTDIVGTRGTILMGGVEGKLTDHLGFQGAAGYEFFNNFYTDSVILAKGLLKWYPNDVVTWTGGYIRSLDEIDSYMSAAGVIPTTGPFAGQLVGRIIDNKFVSDFAFKLPYKFYAYGGFRLGYKYGSNSPVNTYSEIPAGFGKVFYSAKETNFVNQVLLGYDCYYTAYGVDRSGFGGANLLYSPVGSDGGNPEPTPGAAGVGGYFSPTFFLANKFPLTIKGSIRESKLKYVVSGFWGLQTIQGQIGLLGLNNLTPGTIISYQYFGYSAGLRYNEKGKVSLALDYIFNNYMTVAQHLFKVSLLIRF